MVSVFVDLVRDTKILKGVSMFSTLTIFVYCQLYLDLVNWLCFGKIYTTL